MREGSYIDSGSTGLSLTRLIREQKSLSTTYKSPPMSAVTWGKEMLAFDTKGCVMSVFPVDNQQITLGEP